MLSQHIAGERRGAARPLLILSRDLVKCGVRNASSVSLTLYVLKRVLYYRVYISESNLSVTIKISFCVLRSVYFVPSSSLPEALLQQVIGPARALLEVDVHGSSRGSFWEQRTFKAGAPRGPERDYTTSFRVSSNL